MDTQVETLDILAAGKKIGEAFDRNPVSVNTDDECKNLLMKLKADLKLSSDELGLLDSCIAVVSAEDGDDVIFGPGEIVQLALFAENHPDHVTEIMACSHHLSESVDCDGDLPPGIYLSAAGAYGSLSDIMTRALKSGSITSDYNPDDDSITEESISDDDY
jgi:hypothetical protein